jgi:hypothetical protein
MFAGGSIAVVTSSGLGAAEGGTENIEEGAVEEASERSESEARERERWCIGGRAGSRVSDDFEVEVVGRTGEGALRSSEGIESAFLGERSARLRLDEREPEEGGRR